MVINHVSGNFVPDTVTNQAVNAFTELGLPFIMRYITTWRDNSSLPFIGSAKGKASEDVKAKTTEMEMKELDKELTPDERKFLDKVGSELSLPDYNIFGKQCGCEYGVFRSSR